MRKLLPMFAALGFCVPVTTLQAQGSDAHLPSGTALGITVDRFIIASEYSYTSATLHVSWLRPNKLTPEFGLSVFPGVLAEGFLITGVDVGAAFNVALPDATLLLRGGASGLFALGQGGAGALPAVHYGASLLFRIAERGAIRFDVLRRVYLVPIEGSEPTLSLGIGFSTLPRR